jgi:hypothetical protein
MRFGGTGLDDAANDRNPIDSNIGKATRADELRRK